MLSLANAALAACGIEDDQDDEEGKESKDFDSNNEEKELSNSYNNNNNEDSESEYHPNLVYNESPEEEERMYKQEIKRRLERLIEERKAAAEAEAQEMLFCMASSGKNAKEKRKEVKKLMKNKRKEGKKQKEELEKLKKLGPSKRSSSFAHSFYFKARVAPDRKPSVYGGESAAIASTAANTATATTGDIASTSPTQITNQLYAAPSHN